MKINHIFKELLEINLEYYKSLRIKRTISKTKEFNFFYLHNEVQQSAEPVFVLSTGRCGTKYLTEILKKTNKISVNHNLQPELIFYSKYAYENRNENEKLSLIFDAARYEFIRDCYLASKIYVETNNRITFFCNQIAAIYPKSKFVHLIRSPESFVSSGLSRNWYSGLHLHDEGHILFSHRSWTNWSQVQKLAWLWNETNQFIEDFKISLDPSRVITILSENLFTDFNEIKNILRFIGVEVFDEGRIKRLSRKKINEGNSISLSQLEINQVNEKALLAKKYFG